MIFEQRVLCSFAESSTLPGEGFVGMVLAAGLGSRLTPFTSHTPKPLFPVFDRTLLELAVHSLAQAGVRDIVVNAYHLAPQVVAAVRELSTRLPGVDLQVSIEPELMGTGGGLAYARSRFGGRDVVVVNSDVVAEWNVAELCRAHRQWHSAATLVLESGEAHPSLRTTRVGEGNLVHEIAGESMRGAGWGVFSGLYVLAPEAYGMLPARPCSVVTQAISPLVKRGAVRALTGSFPWCDLGTWERLWHWTRLVLAGDSAWEFVRRRSPGRFADGETELAGGLLRGPAYVGPGVNIDGTVGPWTVLSAGSGVARAGEVRGSIILPGVRVEGASIAEVVGNGWSHCLP